MTGGLYLLAAVSLFSLASCAKIADPQPPELLVPKAPVDVSVRQVADRAHISVSPPAENTNGSRVLTLAVVEVFRLAGDRAETGPLPEETFLVQADRIYAVPADQLGQFLAEGRLLFVDTSPFDPESLHARGYRYAVRFINRKNQTAGLSNQAFLAPIPIPSAPSGLSARVFRDRILLSWVSPARNSDGSVPARITGYNIYRGQDPKVFPADPINAALLPKPEFEDRDFEFDQSYYYTVVVVGSPANPRAESAPTLPLAVTPRDTFPPGMPANLSHVLQNGVVTLLWEPPEDADLAGFRVHREDAETGARTVLQQDAVMALSFRDDKVINGKRYQYGVVAVDRKGNAGEAAVISVEVK